MKTLPIVVLLLALARSSQGAADEADPRAARITDRSDATSQVSALTLTNVDVRFGFDRSDDHERVFVATGSLELAIPLRAIASIVADGATSWTVKYQAAGGEASVSGALAPAQVIFGKSEFGSFSLPLVRLSRLEFQQPGAPLKPAPRSPLQDQDGRPSSEGFAAVLTLTDGTRLTATQLQRNEVSAQRVGDPSLLAASPFAVVCNNYMDFKFVRGETLQSIPFGNIRNVEFMPGEEVIITTRGGVEATMKVPRPADETLEGFNGTSARGDFYIPLEYVRSVSFGTDAK